MSSVTSICPSQKEDDPIPIVGIFSRFVIVLAVLGVIHSKTIENAPAFSIDIASFINFCNSDLFLPSTLNFFLYCVIPMEQF